MGCHWKERKINQRQGGKTWANVSRATNMHFSSITRRTISRYSRRRDFENNLPHSSHFNFDLSSRDLLGNGESSRVYNFDGTSYLLHRGDLRKFESKRMWCIIGDDHVLVYVFWGRLCCWAKVSLSKWNSIWSLCVQGNIYSSLAGMWSKASKLPGIPKFLAMTDFGVWASQSISMNVESSENVPLSKMRRNSAPSGVVSFAWTECGLPAGKYHRSPWDYMDRN